MAITDVQGDPPASSRPPLVSSVDWASVIAGTVVAAAIVLVLTGFGTALGLASISPKPGQGISTTFWIILTAAWTVISIVVSYLAGGYIAGRMRRKSYDATAEESSVRDCIGGLIVWGLGMLLTAVLASSIVGGAASVAGKAATAVGTATGGVAQAAGSVLGGAAQAVGQVAGAAIPDQKDGQILGYINNTLMRPVLQGAQQPDGSTNPGAPSTNNEQLAQQTAVIIGNVLRTGDISDQDKTFLAQAVAQRTGLNQTEAKARVDQAVNSAKQAREKAEKAAADAKEKAKQVADEAKKTAIQAAESARKAGILTAFLLAAAALVAAAAAVIGAFYGGQHREDGRIFGGFSYRH